MPAGERNSLVGKQELSRSGAVDKSLGRLKPRHRLPTSLGDREVTYKARSGKSQKTPRWRETKLRTKALVTVWLIGTVLTTRYRRTPSGTPNNCYSQPQDHSEDMFVCHRGWSSKLQHFCQAPIEGREREITSLQHKERIDRRKSYMECSEARKAMKISRTENDINK